MIYKGKLLFIGLIMFGMLAFGTAMAQSETEYYTLEMCINIAKQHNIRLKNSRLDERSAHYQRKELLGMGLPQVNLKGNYNNFLEIFPQGIPGGLFDPNTSPDEIHVIAFGVPHSLKAGLEVSQLIFSQSYLVGLKAARSSEEFYYLLSKQTEQEIIYEVTRNYYGVISANLQKESLKANYDKIQSLKGIIQSQVDNNLVRKVDLSRVNVNLITLETQMDELEISLEQRINYLKLLMAVPMTSTINLAPIDLDWAEKAVHPESMSADISNRYDLKTIEMRQHLNELNVKNIAAGYYPTLSAFLDVNYNAFSNSLDFLSTSHNWFRGSLLGVQLNVPVFNGFQRKHQITQARITSEKLKGEEFNIRQSAAAEYFNASRKINNSLKGLFAQRDNVELSEEVFTQTENLYKEGLASLTDLLDAEAALRESRSAYYRQAVNVKIAEADLLNATGNIDQVIN